jgi:hypothetical protein
MSRVWKRKITYTTPTGTDTPDNPFDTQKQDITQPSAAVSNTDADVYGGVARGFLTFQDDQTSVAMSTDSGGSYEAVQITKDMLNCYRRETLASQEGYCVPDPFNNVCQTCQDVEDPPGSGCLVGDTTCANNYFASPIAGATKGTTT